jgi:hypothetical protein
MVIIKLDTPNNYWTAEDFLDTLARKFGKLLKGGDADRETVAKMVLNDWIRGRIPFFVRPPDSSSLSIESKTTYEEEPEWFGIEEGSSADDLVSSVLFTFTSGIVICFRRVMKIQMMGI